MLTAIDAMLLVIIVLIIALCYLVAVMGSMAAREAGRAAQATQRLLDLAEAGAVKRIARPRGAPVDIDPPAVPAPTPEQVARVAARIEQQERARSRWEPAPDGVEPPTLGEVR